MKQHWKRIVSMMLVGIIIAAGLTFVTKIPPGEDTFASASAQRLKEFAKGKTLKDTNTTVIQDNGGTKVVLKGYSYKGRDACFQQFENGVLMGESYVDHDKGTITSYSREEPEAEVKVVQNNSAG